MFICISCAGRFVWTSHVARQNNAQLFSCLLGTLTRPRVAVINSRVVHIFLTQSWSTLWNFNFRTSRIPTRTHIAHHLSPSNLCENCVMQIFLTSLKLRSSKNAEYKIFSSVSPSQPESSTRAIIWWIILTIRKSKSCIQLHLWKNFRIHLFIPRHNPWWQK